LYDRDEFSQLAMVIGFASLVITIILFLIIFKKIKINVFNKSKFIPEKLKKLFEKIGDYKNAPSKIYQIILLSFLFHTIFITFRFLLIEAVDANIAIYDLIVATMMSTVVALIPITINGLGLLEGSFIFLLVNYGVIYEKAVIIAILIRLLQIPLSLIGGGFYFFEKKTSKIQSNLQQEIHSI
ncbi:MAG: hypothetical protein GWN01_12850, partial [Nitrosopumilaceae archaeon]|nr:flippase-like domain-containing protein [Nitrosopumilaceae archaeon]NIU86084.1 hypothetical protein [Nitrosopumilaceae archaeon]NIX62354.1 hypothetical protein [Nitrosopumilaceae archaeon]